MNDKLNSQMEEYQAQGTSGTQAKSSHTTHTTTQSFSLDDLTQQDDQTIDKEYNAYMTAPLLPPGTDVIKFWEASCTFFLLHRWTNTNIILPSSTEQDCQHCSQLPLTTCPSRHQLCPVSKFVYQVRRPTQSAKIASMQF
jgi:hypothetical protein